MPSSKKILAVQNLTEKVKLTKALILTDYSGLKVGQISELRTELRKVGAEYEVVKNNLLSLALKGEPLTGPTAALWVYQADDVTPLKTLAAFIKKNELPKIKMGFWDKELISAEKVMQLANLPGIDELKAKLVGIINSPIYRLVYTLNGNLQKLVFILGAASTQVTAAKEGVKTNG
jgi:large subunit ribosomal protein L10